MSYKGPAAPRSCFIRVRPQVSKGGTCVRRVAFGSGLCGRPSSDGTAAAKAPAREAGRRGGVQRACESPSGESFFFEDLATAHGEGRRGFGKLKRRERGWTNEQVNIGIIEKQEKLGKFRENR